MKRYNIDICTCDGREAVNHTKDVPDNYGEWVKYDDAAARIAKLEAQLAASQAECERLRIQLAACGVAANANTWESAAEMRQQLAAEKKRSMYYQHIVYNVCNMLDQIDGRRPGNGIVCGTAEEPCSDVETRIQQLTTELDSLRQQLSAAQEHNLVLARGILSVQDLINESRGVDGYHRNGNIAEWDELLDDGCMLDEYSKALHLIHKTTTDSLRELPAPPEQEVADESL